MVLNTLVPQSFACGGPRGCFQYTCLYLRDSTAACHVALAYFYFYIKRRASPPADLELGFNTVVSQCFACAGTSGRVSVHLVLYLKALPVAGLEAGFSTQTRVLPAAGSEVDPSFFFWGGGAFLEEGAPNFRWVRSQAPGAFLQH